VYYIIFLAGALGGVKIGREQPRHIRVNCALHNPSQLGSRLAEQNNAA